MNKDVEKKLSTATTYSIDSISNRNKALVKSILRRERQRDRKIGAAIQFENTNFDGGDNSSICGSLPSDSPMGERKLNDLSRDDSIHGVFNVGYSRNGESRF